MWCKVYLQLGGAISHIIASVRTAFCSHGPLPPPPSPPVRPPRADRSGSLDATQLAWLFSLAHQFVCSASNRPVEKFDATRLAKSALGARICHAPWNVLGSVREGSVQRASRWRP